jgi:ribosomal protein S18 acetylase RimI-like enzyme
MEIYGPFILSEGYIDQFRPLYEDYLKECLSYSGFDRVPFKTEEDFIGFPVWLLRHNDEILGFVIGGETNQWNSVYYVKDLYIKPAFRRQGYATLLFNHLKQYVQERTDIKYLNLHVFIANEAAKRLYANLGFRPYSEYQCLEVKNAV